MSKVIYLRTLIRILHSIQCPSFSFMAERFPGGRFSFKWWGKTHTGSSHRRRSVNFWLWLLPSLISCHSETTWLWIPHWDELGPEGPPANLQVALLHRNSCSLHLPAQLCTYLSEVCATSFVMTETSLIKSNANQCLLFFFAQGWRFSRTVVWNALRRSRGMDKI